MAGYGLGMVIPVRASYYARPGGEKSAELVGLFGPMPHGSQLANRLPPAPYSGGLTGEEYFQTGDGETNVVAPATEAEVDYMVAQLVKEKLEVERREKELDAREALLDRKKRGSVGTAMAAADPPAPQSPEAYSEYVKAASEAGDHIVPPAAQSGINVNLDVHKEKTEGAINVNMHVSDAAKSTGSDDEKEEKEDGYSDKAIEGGDQLLSRLQSAALANPMAATKATKAIADTRAKHQTHRAALHAHAAAEKPQQHHSAVHKGGKRPQAAAKRGGVEHLDFDELGIKLDDTVSPSSPLKDGSRHTEKMHFKGFGMDLAATLKVTKWEPGAAAWYAYSDAQGKYNQNQQGLSEGAGRRLGGRGTVLVAWGGALAAAVMGHALALYR